MHVKLRKLSMSNHLRTQKYQVTECRDPGITGKKVDEVRGYGRKEKLDVDMCIYTHS